MIDPIGYGIDLSHHQPSSKLPWKTFEGNVSFVFARAAYGAKLLDDQAVEHVRNARAIGAKVGLYIFYRPTHSVSDHWDALRLMIDRCGIGEGDIVPALDIELDPYPHPQPVAPRWSDDCEELVGKMVVNFGEAFVYISEREWRFLGSPGWVVNRPLWVAFYSSAQTPRSPNDKRPTIWQHRVDDFVPNGPGGYDKTASLPIDQNRLFEELPLIGRPPSLISDPERDRILGQISLALDSALRDDALHPAERAHLV